MSFPARNIELLSVTRGDTATYRITLLQDGVALDLTEVDGITFTAKARESDLDAAALISKALGDGISTEVAANGTALLELSTSDTEALSAGRTYFFDVQVETATGEKVTAAIGRLACRQQITRA
jgi:hypothetical protein